MTLALDRRLVVALRLHPCRRLGDDLSVAGARRLSRRPHPRGCRDPRAGAGQSPPRWWRRVIGNLICFPAGPAAETTFALRIFSAAAGFAAYFWIGRKVLLGIIVAEAIFGLGFYQGY